MYIQFLAYIVNYECSPKIDCFVRTMFTGILAYAYDIPLLAPTPQAETHALCLREIRYGVWCAV